jgi:hypothetical protein
MTRHSLRPRLEVLETRDAPSGLQAQTNTVNSDFSTLKKDVSAVVSVPNTTTFAQRQVLTSKVNSDVGTLQGDFNSLKTTTTNTQNLLFLLTFAALEGGQMSNPMVDIALFAGFNQVNTAKNLTNTLPGQVSSQGTQSLPNFPGHKVNDAMTDHGFHTLALQ